jgi:DNA-binding LacI/PurR family transcriptional regulator
LRGLEDGLEVPWETVPVLETPVNSVENGGAGAHVLLDAHPGLTAIVAMSDVLALGVLEAARERGLSVPYDLSVTGFDDAPAAVEAGLTTVAQPLLDKGRVAGGLLLDEGDHTEPRLRMLPTSLVVRGTTSPPR